jgi:hypothetical protein
VHGAIVHSLKVTLPARAAHPACTPAEE